MATLVDRLTSNALCALGIRSRFVSTRLARHHVYDSGGAGRPVVCLPGLSDSAASWAPVMLALRQRGYRVLAVEGAGHGLSPQSTRAYTVETHFASITDALDELLGGSAVLVGNSLGGATALHYATARPASVAALFLTSPGGSVIDEASLAGIRNAFTLRTLRDARVFLSRVLHRPTPLHRAMARHVLAYNASRAVGEIIASLHVGHVIEGLGSIDVPIRVVWGRSERLLPSASLEWLREHLPWHATVTQPDGFGHCPHIDDPLRLARMIHAFVRVELAVGARANVLREPGRATA